LDGKEAKTYQTSLGFSNLAIAALSIKTDLEARARCHSTTLHAEGINGRTIRQPRGGDSLSHVKKALAGDDGLASQRPALSMI
jgi:hypothetical protein